MNCYYHPNTPAIALCKSCNRALCFECAVDVPPGTACKNRCEKDVATLNEIIQRNKTAYQKTGYAYKRNGLALLILAFIFLVLGFLPYVVNGEKSGFVMAFLSLPFFLFSYFSFKSGYLIEKVDRDN
ncbi:MAG: hypothetical protein R3F23_07795 [Verrucomicrobiia bacterium]